jgi:hypothetical protein
MFRPNAVRRTHTVGSGAIRDFFGSLDRYKATKGLFVTASSEEGKKIYKQRAATSETVNAELRTYRGLAPLTVRGFNKIKCVGLWRALAYNLTHFSKALLS